MKEILTSSDNQTIDHDLHVRLFATSCFPTSETDIAQWLWLHEAERSRWLSNPSGFQMSFLARQAQNGEIKRSGKRAMAAVTAYAFLFLHDRGLKPSLEKASFLASEAGYQFEKVRVSIDKEEKLLKLNADRVGVKKAFREYRSVSHILIASLALDEASLPSLTCEYSAKNIEYVTALVLAAQDQLDRAKVSEDFGLIRLRDNTDSISTFPNLSASKELTSLRESFSDILAKSTFPSLR